MYKKRWVVCCAPGCGNKSTLMPDKVFFKMPADPATRNAWINALNLTDLPSSKMIYICEDHFNKEDIENYSMKQILGIKTSRLVLRKGVLPRGENEEKENRDPQIIGKTTKSTQTSQHVASKGVQCRIQTTYVNPVSSDSSTSSPVQKRRKVADEYINIFESTTSPSPSSNSDSDETSIKDQACKISIYYIEKDPKYYLGLTPEAYELVNILTTNLKTAARNIFIVLKKISLDHEFKSLSDDFGLSISQTSYIFKWTLYKVNDALKKFVFFPPSVTIKKNLPIPFRMRYKSVVSIIDCFEVIIEKPQNPLHQALTWSDYKKNNTIKYFVSCTPDGFINFISRGFGGRASDITVVLNSGYLDCLPKNGVVMADRGFKGLDTHLQKVGCSLIRPSSVTGEKLSSEDVLETKRIASLRIHVERVINRIRHFKSLSLHSCLNRNLVQHLDEMVFLACSLINTQGYIMKDLL